MNCKFTWKVLAAAALAGVMMFNPLLADAEDAKGKTESYASQSLESKVKEALREHEDVKVEVTGEDVVLRGHVLTQDEKIKLEDRIRQVPGVKDVRNEVTVGKSTMDVIEDSVEDSAITTKVKGMILITKELESLDIHVKTTQGVVTLSGKVENADEIKLAEKVARGVKGVKDVVNKLAVK